MLLMAKCLFILFRNFWCFPTSPGFDWKHHRDARSQCGQMAGRRASAMRKGRRQQSRLNDIQMLYVNKPARSWWLLAVSHQPHEHGRARCQICAASSPAFSPHQPTHTARRHFGTSASSHYRAAPYTLRRIPISDIRNISKQLRRRAQFGCAPTLGSKASKLSRKQF